MAILIGVIVGLIALTLLVAIHELGHGIVARRNGVKVEEFGIGFPPKAWGRKIKSSVLGKNVLYSVNWLPLGGFVRLQGENDAATGKGDYGAASFWVKTKILLAGVFMNWMTAGVLLTILAITGLPQVINDQFTVSGDTKTVSGPVQLTQIKDNYPAAKAGLKSGDKIVSFAGVSVNDPQQFIDLTRKHAGEQTTIRYTRDGETKTISVKLRQSHAETDVVFGAGLGQQSKTRSTWSAPIVGFAVTGQLTWETLHGLGSMIGNLANGLYLKVTGNASEVARANSEIAAAGDSVAGPVGILGVIFPAATQAGLTLFVLLVALISIALAVMNVLPIPALDGGRWFTMAVFRLFKKDLTKEREEKIQATGFSILMILVLVITVADIGKIIK